MPEGDHAVYINYQTAKINSFVRDGPPTTTEFNFSLVYPASVETCERSDISIGDLHARCDSRRLWQMACKVGMRVYSQSGALLQPLVLGASD